ncbi:MAG: GNAT family N-acetyltransferase [Flavobacteriales bacterium]|jgi:GNAT superfamily N-acetyltransferase|nr:GNAT family N-acetyltransferase [Flavobacteriales bacterium]
MKNSQFKLIDPLKYKDRILELLLQLNPDKEVNILEPLLVEMCQLSNYTCFGLFEGEELIGVSTGWTTVRIYCGKQIELDNVIIDSHYQSKGYGKYFMEEIKHWSLANGYKSIGLNTYVQNSRSHKFYFNEGFKILGFHFEKRMA